MSILIPYLKLQELTKANVGCFIGNFFIGALAYADDIVLLAPTSRAMRIMLSVCDRFAKEFQVSFNAKKSKCLICPSSKVSFCTILYLDSALMVK